MKLESCVTRKFSAGELQDLAERSHPMYEERCRQRAADERRRRRRDFLWCVMAGLVLGALIVVLVRA